MTDTVNIPACSGSAENRQHLFRTALFVATCFVLFLIGRAFFVLRHDGGLTTTVQRANGLAWLFALIFAVFAVSIFRHSGWKKTLFTGSLARFAGASLTSLIIGAEIAQLVHEAYPEYWNWSRDWSEFLFKIVGSRGLIGCGIGAISVVAYWVLSGKLTKPWKSI